MKDHETNCKHPWRRISSRLTVIGPGERIQTRHTCTACGSHRIQVDNGGKTTYSHWTLPPAKERSAG